MSAPSHLYSFTNRRYESFHLTTRQAIGVLAISEKYCVKSGIDAGIHFLSNPAEGEFKTSFKLRLAWQYNITEWIDSSIAELLTPPFDELTTYEVDDLESEIVMIIVACRERISRHRLELIPYLPDAVHTASCPNRGTCFKNWQTAFSSSMLYFTHTRRFYSGREVFKKLQSLDITNFNPECRRLTLEALESSGVLWREESFINIASESIKKVLARGGPRTPRPEPRFKSPKNMDSDQ